MKGFLAVTKYSTETANRNMLYFNVIDIQVAALGNLRSSKCDVSDSVHETYIPDCNVPVVCNLRVIHYQSKKFTTKFPLIVSKETMVEVIHTCFLILKRYLKRCDKSYRFILFSAYVVSFDIIFTAQLTYLMWSIEYKSISSRT